ncbi:MAG: 30S ribosomal protein S4 [Candidatus Omnitrophota bacterium]|nr:30S ribosomal protein S4 [Candidatus Omnitrophota bacterium]MBU1894422.1 30S ribosomal protein S4 [Candidatus Omnitrophota bacterium]
MARRITPSCRLCRRENEKLFLKGAKCSTDKCSFLKREYAPGQHGQMRKRKKSGYAIQLREKQKAKRIYGMLEKQFKNYFKKAEKAKGATGEVLLQLLECRLDNVIFRACFAASRANARQLVGHGFVKVNGRKVNIPSFLVKEGDEVEMKGNESQIKEIKETAKILEDRGTPEWIEVSAANLALKVKRAPTKGDIGMAIEENLIVELYSK